MCFLFASPSFCEEDCFLQREECTSEAVVAIGRFGLRVNYEHWKQPGGEVRANNRSPCLHRAQDSLIKSSRDVEISLNIQHLFLYANPHVTNGQGTSVYQKNGVLFKPLPHPTKHQLLHLSGLWMPHCTRRDLEAEKDLYDPLSKHYKDDIKKALSDELWVERLALQMRNQVKIT